MAGEGSEFVKTDVCLSSRLLQTLNEMRLRGDLCDVSLKVGQENFTVHRIVLAANSPYFNAMLANKEHGTVTFKESNRSDIVLHEVDPVGAQIIIDYFYTGTIEVNTYNFEAVFATANIWQVEFVLQTCELFLEREMSVFNCLGIQILLTANLTFSERIRKFADLFVNAHFMEICQESEILTIPKDHLKTLLLKDGLCVISEEILVDIVLRWLKHDLANRRFYATELLSAIRLGLIGKEFLLDTVLQTSTILDDSSVNQLLQNVLLFLEGDQSIKISDYLTTKRKSHVLYVCGGLSRNLNYLRQVDSVDFLGLSQEKWENFPEAKLPEANKQFFKFVVANGYLYAVGLRKVLCFCLKRLQWEELYAESGGVKSLDIKNAGVCISSGCIYVIGGASCAKKFRLSTYTWCTIFSSSDGLPEEHYRPGVCVHDGAIYVIGGCDCSYNDGKKIVESFDVKSGMWTRRASMPTARWGLEAIPLNGYIYAVGGYDTGESVPLNTVEILSSSTDTWQTACSLTIPRRRFGSTVVNGIIYVVGGYEEESVEYYDEDKKMWVVFEGLKINRFDCSCFSMEPPNCFRL